MILIDITPAGETIALVSVGLAVMNALVRRAVIDREKFEEHKRKLKEHQQVVKEASKAGDVKKAQKAQEELMTLMMEQLKHSFKPMIFTIIPFLLVFSWLNQQYGRFNLFGILDSTLGVGPVATLLGFDTNWILWYLLCSIAISTVLNKTLRLT